MYTIIPVTTQAVCDLRSPARRSRAIPISSNTFRNNNNSSRSYDFDPLLQNDKTLSTFAGGRKKRVVTSEVELADIGAAESGNILNPHTHSYSFWAKYNPFSRDGRQLLSRKIRSSGPAVRKERNIDDVERGWLAKLKRTTGWRAGTQICCLAVILCIIIELVLLIWAVVTNGHRATTGLIYEGGCDTVRKLEVWLLLPLNIAATILISTSNYVMQVMSAPDREEIDQAHRFAKPIAVGGIRSGASRCDYMKSTQNNDPDRPELQKIGALSDDLQRNRSRRFLWWLLLLSSLPIHLFLNVAFYGSVQASNTGVVIVSEEFDKDLTWGLCDSDPVAIQNSTSANFTCSLKQSFERKQTQQMSASQCMSQYARGFQTNASSVIIVTESDTNPWYTFNATARVSSSYGIPCRPVTSDMSTFVEVPDSEQVFSFSYAENTGSMTVELNFTLCQNETSTNSSLKALQNQLVSFTTIAPLILRETDILANISSIRSLYNALDYRYLATASLASDYLGPQTQSLLDGWDSRSWLCNTSSLTPGRQCDLTPSSTNWKITPEAYLVKGCHVMAKEEKCALRYSLQILIITMCCDVIKLFAMVFALRSVSKPLTTLGDVIESFLQEPDLCTKYVCPLNDYEAAIWSFKSRKKILEAERQYAQVDWISALGSPFGTNPMYRGPTDFEEKACQWLLNGGPWWGSVQSAKDPDSWSPERRRWVVIPSILRWIILTTL